MNKKGFVNIILIVIIVILVGVVGYFVLVRKPEVVPVSQIPPPTTEEPTITENWLTYEWGIVRFKYPPDWRVEKNYYKTPAQEAAGEPASVIGLTASPGDKPVDNYSILFGGRQVNCQNLNVPRCFTFYTIPIYTFNKNSEILGVFDSLIKSISYNNPDATFQILFPEAKAQLEPNTTYTIRWKTKPDLQIKKVKLIAFDTSRYWQEGLILSVENIPNTGSYEWTIPSVIKSEGPYLLGVSYCESIIPPPVGTISSCKLHEGWSDLFYISVSK